MENITEILLSCEQDHPSCAYSINPDTYKVEPGGYFSPTFPVITTPVQYNSGCDEIIVISDLHMAAGTNAMGVYNGSENFFADTAFERFFNYTNSLPGAGRKLLVLNGDTFDFLRVADYPEMEPKESVSKKISRFFYATPPKAPAAQSPETGDEFEYWQQELSRTGIIKTVAQLRSSISDREKRYGLETDDYKTIYKLIRIQQGHPLFFTVLANWLSKGNRILITKGNHDMELVWPAVRNYIRLLMAERIDPVNSAAALRNIVLPNIFFADDAVMIDDDLYIEHGHRYDKFAMVLGEPLLKNNPTQINIPFGSFFNRYVINRVELYYPYIDKVRPTGNILPILIRENFPLALKLFVFYFPFLFRMLITNRRYLWFMLRRVIPLLLIFVPVAIYVYVFFFGANKSVTAGKSFLPGMTNAAKILGSTGSLLLSYFIARIVSWFQLVEPSALDNYAYRLYAHTGRTYQLMSMGHTHNPGSYPNGEGSFYNTGTWIPVIETSNAEVREDRTYTFLHLIKNQDGKFQPVDDHLQRWNDDAGRPEQQLLIKRKP